MSSDENDPTVGELSEGQVLRSILSQVGRVSSALVGPGDDAAVLADAGPVVATTDTLVHGPDFRLAWSSGYDLGWKAAAVNLADIAAMGARPTALLVALAMPNDTRLSFVEDLARGLRDACDSLAPGCGVVGGDLTVSPTLTVAVTALGSLDGGTAVLRSGARPGDVIAVAGELGQAAKGLAILFGRFTDDAGEPITLDPVAIKGVPDGTAQESAAQQGDAHAVEMQLRPSPPISMGPVAAASGATAMMDVSDGLVLDATRMADASGVTIDIDSRRLGPLPRLALGGGEDHALLAAFPAGVALPAGFTRLGTVAARGEHPVTVDGHVFGGPVGWDPYRDWDSRAG